MGLVNIYLKSQTKIDVHPNVIRTFQEGNFFCVVVESKHYKQRIIRYMLSDILRVDEWTNEDKGVITTTPAPIQREYIYITPPSKIFPCIDEDFIKVGDVFPNPYPITVSMYLENDTSASIDSKGNISG